MDRDGTTRENNMEALGGIQGTHGDIIVAHRKHGRRKTRIEIKMEGKQLDLISISDLDGWMITLGTGSLLSSRNIIMCLPVMFEDETFLRGV